MNWGVEAIDRIGAGQPVVLVTIVHVQGSAPRDAGAKMLIWSDGQAGSVGGGELEYQLTRNARDMIEQGKQVPVLDDFPLGPQLEQCCGGQVRVLLETLDRKHDMQNWLNGKHQVLTDLQTGKKTCTVSNLRSGQVSVLDKQKRPSADFLPLVECAYVCEQPGPLLPHIYLFGAGHIGTSLYQTLRDIPVHLHWQDSRRDTENPMQMIADAPASARFVILTHSHQLDYELCKQVLSKDEVRFCGLIGSKTKRARFVSRLSQDGLSASQISRLTCPVGLPEIGGKHPGEIAISIAAQLLEQQGNEPNGT